MEWAIIQLSNFQATQPDTYLFDLCYITPPTVYTGTPPTRPDLAASMRERTKYTDAENIKAYRLQDVYNWAITSGASFYTPTSSFKTDDGSATTPSTYPNAVIGDVFQRATINAHIARHGRTKSWYACALLQGRPVKTQPMML